jgi:hypothetical protein
MTFNILASWTFDGALVALEYDLTAGLCKGCNPHQIGSQGGENVIGAVVGLRFGRGVMDEK